MGEAEMGLQRSDDSESRFTGYVEGLVSVLGHTDRAGPLRDYCMGLMMPCERKSVEPMEAVTAPERTAAQHQSLLHFVGQAAWSDEKVLAKVREMVLPAIELRGPVEAWIIDDTAFAKKGTIRNSSRRSGSDISKGEDGAASTTTPRCASRPTDSWSPRGRRFPPQDLVAPRCSRNLPFPTVTDPEAPPLRTQRHVPNSIATMRNS
jgi:DDE superfamily endonuclease